MDTTKHLTSRQLMYAACSAWGVGLSEFCGTGRHRALIKCRQAYGLLARALTSESYPEIARGAGRTNHSTIITWNQCAKERFQDDKALRELVAVGYRSVVQLGYGLSPGAHAARDLCADAFSEWGASTPGVSGGWCSRQQGQESGADRRPDTEGGRLHSTESIHLPITIHIRRTD